MSIERKRKFVSWKAPKVNEGIKVKPDQVLQWGMINGRTLADF